MVIQQYSRNNWYATKWIWEAFKNLISVVLYTSQGLCLIIRSLFTGSYYIQIPAYSHTQRLQNVLNNYNQAHQIPHNTGASVHVTKLI